ncbi:MAG: thiol reductase thioredoxin [Kordiimonadaceae bacterium]|jgi:hypothetical protein|nr:thiol reductase thioredoxin [Kordiimonadaceae bacterium]MBT6032427.1 thiol reductase thioredoxin [Kordiimonadaceae bacterium]
MKQILFALITFCLSYLPSMAQDKILLGEISKSDLQQAPFSTWYEEYENGYQVDAASIEGLQDLLKGVEIKIGMGTWCHDSKREVPRFYKILDQAGINLEQTKMYGLDRKKQSDNSEAISMQVQNTASIVFYKNGIEMNRIVERPVVSLEKDMMTILRGEKYRHSKMP